MASTYSTSLKIQLMGNGEDSGTWGSISNTNWNLMEQAVAGVQTITMANANYTLSNLNGVSDEARNMVLVVQGTNSGIYQIIAPLNQPKMYVIYNNTTGGYAITIGASSGSVITIPNGVTAQVYTDGTNFFSAQTGSAGNFNVNGTLTASGITDTGALSAASLTVSGTLGVTGATTLSTGAISGIMTAPTAAPGTNTTQLATTAFVQNVAGGLGTMSTQNANNVAITGGTINGVTGSASGFTAGNVSGTVAAANGGTGLTSAGTSGNLLVSNGTTWTSASIASSGIKLGLGITGETWHDVTGSRATGTTLNNNNGYPIQVAVTSNQQFFQHGFNIYVNGVLILQPSGGGNNYTHTVSATFNVPTGATYRVDLTTGNTTMALWTELY